MLCLLLAAASWPARSAEAASVEVAPVTLDGRVLFHVRGVTAFPAQQRAREISARIEAIAGDPSIPVSALRIVDRPDRIDILAGDRPIVSVYGVDASVEQLDRNELLAEINLQKIAAAIEQYRRERTAAYLGGRALEAAAVLLAIGALLWLIRWAALRLERRAERRFARRLQALQEKSFNLVSAEQLKTTALAGLRGLGYLLLFAVAFAGLSFVFGLFPWTRPISTLAQTLLVEPLLTMGLALQQALPGLIFIAILVVVTHYALRLVQLFFGGIAAGTIRFAGFAEEWAWPTYRLVRFGAIAFAAVVAYPYIPGSSSEAFKGISLFVGLLMSLGAANVVGNALAGYTLIYRRAFKLGDRIRVGEILGDVIEIRQQVTHLRTVKNEEITIPSSTLLNSHVVNYSSLANTKGLILHTEVGIGYETPWRQVEAMLLLAAARTEGLMTQPAPFVEIKSLGDFCIVYEINAYNDNAAAMQKLYSALHRHILDIFNEHGVQITSPHYVADPEAQKVVPRDRWFAAPAKDDGQSAG